MLLANERPNLLLQLKPVNGFDKQFIINSLVPALDALDFRFAKHFEAELTDVEVLKEAHKNHPFTESSLYSALLHGHEWLFNLLKQHCGVPCSVSALFDRALAQWLRSKTKNPSVVTLLGSLHMDHSHISSSPPFLLFQTKPSRAPISPQLRGAIHPDAHVSAPHLEGYRSCA
jgi:hypothetical protein